MAPFYNAVKGTTAGTPGTGAFTPNAASTGYRAWSTVPTGWIGLVRYEDGTAWELTYSYWNGTTLSRASTQVYDSSTGSQLTLTSSATAALVVDASEVMSHVGTTPWKGYAATVGATGFQAISIGSATVTGTAAGVSPATTNYLTLQARIQITSATTASGQAGITNSASLVAISAASGAGFEYTARFGASALPTGPRLMAGMASSVFNGSTAEPSAFGNSVAAFTLDSTDTNIQLCTRPFGGPPTKNDTGIPFAANGWYEVSVWSEPSGTTVYGLIIRLDTGAIWFGKNTTNLPTSGNGMSPNLLAGLNGTNTGTAAVFHVGSMFIRSNS